MIDRPVILVVDDGRSPDARITTELERRYAQDYEIVYLLSAAEAIARLEALCAQAGRVALVLANKTLPDAGGAELLSRVRELYPDAATRPADRVGRLGGRGDRHGDPPGDGYGGHGLLRPPTLEAAR